MARFSSQSTQIGDFFGNVGTVSGNILVIFYNGMINSQLSLTDTEIFSGYLLPTTNQIGGACLTIISTLFQTCSFSSSKEFPIWTPIALNNIYTVSCGSGTNCQQSLLGPNMEEDSISQYF